MLITLDRQLLLSQLMKRLKMKFNIFKKTLRIGPPVPPGVVGGPGQSPQYLASTLAPGCGTMQHLPNPQS